MKRRLKKKPVNAISSRLTGGVAAVLLAISLVWPARQSRIDVKAMTDKVSASVGAIQPDGNWRAGTGWVMKLPSGRVGVITNDHVCRGVSATSATANVVLGGKPYLGATILKQDATRDLCVYTVPNLPEHLALPVVEAPSYHRGQELYVLGHPLGNPLTPAVGFYVAGIVINFGSIMRPGDECPPDNIAFNPLGLVCVKTMQLETTTIPVFPGNSGSPVLDSAGRVVGVINSTDTRNYQGLFISGQKLQEFVRGL